MTRAPNIAVLGCGSIVRRGHLPGLLANGKPHVPVIYGPDTPNSHELAKSFGIPHLVHTIEETLATEDLDGVVIALPNYQHAPAALAAIEAGLPILMEKPIASDIATARGVVAAAKASGTRIAMSLPQRQRPSLIHLRGLISSGALGRIESVDVRMTRRAGIPGYGGWFTQRTLSGGGVLMDLGPHVIDTVFWLTACSAASHVTGRLWSTHGPRGRGLGEWGSRRSDPGSDRPVFDVEDRAWFALQLSCGTHVTCEIAWAHYGNEENRIRIVGHQGGGDYWPEGHGIDSPLRFYCDREDRRPADGDAPLSADHDPLEFAWTRVAETFVDDLNREHSRLVSGAETLVAAELIQRIYDSSPPRSTPA